MIFLEIFLAVALEVVWVRGRGRGLAPVQEREVEVEQVAALVRVVELEVALVGLERVARVQAVLALVVLETITIQIQT